MLQSAEWFRIVGGRTVFLFGLCCLGIFSKVPAAESSSAPLLAEEDRTLEAELGLRWEVEAAFRALESGLPLAGDLLDTLLADPDLDPGLERRLQLARVTAAIGEEDTATAENVLQSIARAELSVDEAAALTLREGIVAYLKGEVPEAIQFLREVNPENLENGDPGWFFTLSGLLAENEGRYMEAANAFQEARSLAGSPFQRRVAESLIQRNLLLREGPSESLVRDLEILLEENRNSRLAVQYAQELAVSLAGLGRETEALRVLRDQIEVTLPENEDQLDPLYLLSALIDRDTGGSGHRSLEWLLRFGENRNYREVALRFLLEDAVEAGSEERLLQFISETLADQPNHDLAAELLYTRGILLQETGQTEEARIAFNRLLAEFPGSSYAAEGLRMLALLAWEAGEYRVAADTFSRLRNMLPAGPERVETAILQGDAYFRNKDFDTAAQAYEAVLPEIDDPYRAETVLYQSVMARIESGQLQEAVSLLDQTGLGSIVQPTLRWEAEWNLIDAMRRGGEVESAFARIQSFFQSENNPALSEGLNGGLLQLRFTWLEALLALETGAFDRVQILTDRILSALEDEPTEATVAGHSLDTIRARTLLLKSQAHLREAARQGMVTGVSEEARTGFEVIEALETRYPDAAETQQALFEQARFLREAGRAVDAQNIYLSIFERDPSSAYAPIALYEAAINAANLIALENPDTLDIRQSEPIRLLNELTRNYEQDSQLFFYARLKQGDIARDLGQFAVAQTLYEEIIKQFPEHPERHLPEMGRADSILAQAGDDPDRFGEAMVAYERLVERPGVPTDLKIEAGYKWAFASASRGDRQRAQTVHHLIHTRFLFEREESAGLGPTGRYWLSRSLLNSAQIFEREAEPRAARELYEAILEYGLPGENLATTNLKRLGGGEIAALPRNGSEP